MTTRFESLALHEFYHVYNRGTEKRILFKDTADYTRFIELLYLSNTTHSINVRGIRRTESSIFDFDREEQLVYIGAYCLMPNHFHILLTPSVEHGIEKFMLKLGTGYSMYFNKRYDRTGTLFQGRFKSRHAHLDEYLKYLFSYIHLNPIKLIQPDWKEVGVRNLRKAREYLRTYTYSSLLDYQGIRREENNILDPQKFPQYFRNKTEVDAELLEWLSYRDVIEIEKTSQRRGSP
jgi:putative transposase